MKTTKLSIFLAILAVFTFVSCSDYDNGFTEAQIRYEKKFIDAFGYIDPAQDWNLVRQLAEKEKSTRAANPNSNMWENDGYVIPADITDEEIAKVRAVFDQKGEEHYESLVDWDCFFVQQVWKGNASYTAGNGGTVVGGNVMDWLCAGSAEMGDDHVNNFNNASGSIMLMYDSSTQRFGFKSATDNGHVFYYFRMEYIDGAYYVGFDFSAEGQNPNEQVQRDFIYNDWIIKIVPGKGGTPTEPTPPDDTDPEEVWETIEAGLLVCEDLGGFDFDFNDIVLKLEQMQKKLAYPNGKVEPTEEYLFRITAMAAGGTLPSYVYYKQLKNAEDFNLPDWTPFGDSEEQNGIHGMVREGAPLVPLNVGDNFRGEGASWDNDISEAIKIIKEYESEDLEYQEKIRAYADHYVSYVFDRARIKIYVGDSNPENATLIQPIQRGADKSEDNSVFTSANVPQMMLLPLRFEWPTEMTFINFAYPDFVWWVRDATNTDWYLNKDDNRVTSREVVGVEELQPMLRWVDNEDIFLSITLEEGKTATLPFTTLSAGGFKIDYAQDGTVDVGINTDSNKLLVTALAPGNATISLTQYAHVNDQEHQYRSESITVNVTVEEKTSGGGKEEEGDEEGGDGEETEDGKLITKTGTKAFSTDEVINAAHGNENVTITLIKSNPTKMDYCNLLPGKDGNVVWDVFTQQCKIQSETDTRVVLVIPTSCFETIKDKGYSEFYLQCNANIKEMYAK